VPVAVDLSEMSEVPLACLLRLVGLLARGVTMVGHRAFTTDSRPTYASMMIIRTVGFEEVYHLLAYVRMSFPG
jgi:hypothetical protein